MLTFNANTVTNQPSANIDHAKPIALIQCIKLDQPHIVRQNHPAASDYEENIAAYRAPISIASWNREAFANWMGRKGHGERDCSNVSFEIRGRLSHR